MVVFLKGSWKVKGWIYYLVCRVMLIALDFTWAVTFTQNSCDVWYSKPCHTHGPAGGEKGMGGLAAFEATNVLATVEERGQRGVGMETCCLLRWSTQVRFRCKGVTACRAQNEASGFNYCKRNCLGGVPIIFLDMHVLWFFGVLCICKHLYHWIWF